MHKRHVPFKLEQKTRRRKNLSLNRVFHKLDNNKWKMHTGARARKQKYISIYISLYMKTFLKTGVYIYIYIYIYIYKVPPEIFSNSLIWGLFSTWPFLLLFFNDLFSTKLPLKAAVDKKKPVFNTLFTSSPFPSPFPPPPQLFSTYHFP